MLPCRGTPFFSFFLSLRSTEQTWPILRSQEPRPYSVAIWYYGSSLPDRPPQPEAATRSLFLLRPPAPAARARRRSSATMVAASAAERTYGAAARSALAALERNLIPDAVTRRLTRLLLARRLRQGYLPSAPLQLQQLLHFVHCESVHRSVASSVNLVPRKQLLFLCIALKKSFYSSMK